MVNAWSLAYDVINGTMDENFPVKKTEPDDDIVISTGSTASTEGWGNFDLTDQIDNITIDTSNFETLDLSGIDLDGMTVNYDMDPDLSYMEPGTQLKVDTDPAYADTWPHAETLKLNIPTPGIESNNPRKYKEDESIKALQNYISTTYNGHYTSKQNNVQTLDLIESVGDAEAFCRSNAIKYLSRYDKKGQAKRDILKALHYSLLLYHFSGQINETPTRGYETF